MLSLITARETKTMAEAIENWRETWWGVLKVVAYELRPFTLPTKDDLKQTAIATRTNAEQLWAEANRLAPVAVEVTRGLNPLRVVQFFVWLFGWVSFIWLEFGECYFRQSVDLLYYYIIDRATTL